MKKLYFQLVNNLVIPNAFLLALLLYHNTYTNIQRLVEPVHVHHERLLGVSVLGFLVNIIGIFVFAHGGAHGHSHGGGGHGHSHGGQRKGVNFYLNFFSINFKTQISNNKYLCMFVLKFLTR